MTNNALLLNAAHVPVPDDPFRGAKLFRPPVPAHEDVTRAYVAAAGALNARLNALLFRALQLAPAECDALGSKPFMVLKQMRYAGDPSDPENGKFGAGAHADWGAFTLLATDATPGLQIQMGGEWLPVPPLPGCLIINSGDQISHLTNDVYRSAVHRVVTTSSMPRFSTAVFTYFTLEAEVAPLPRLVTPATPARHPSGRTTKEYFHFKLHESMERGGSYAAPAPDAA
jgi:isopenicillin N synthase-like dioxygenase